MIDIDTYTRPADGNLPKTTLFVQDNYLKSRRFALEVLSWFLARQKCS